MTQVAGPPRPPRIPKDPPPRVVASALVDTLVDLDGVTTPLVEPDLADPGRRIVTFLWQGEAREVVVMVNKLTDPSVWAESTLERRPGTDLWHRSYSLSADWRATYHLAPLPHEELAPEVLLGPRRRWNGAAAHAITDPRNPRTFPPGNGLPPLSVVELDGAPSRAQATRAPGVARGRVTREPLAGSDRPGWIYTPATDSGAPLDVLVLLDGKQWLTRMDAPAILDNLIAAGTIRPTLAVLPDAGDTATRWRELTANPEVVDALATDTLDWVAARWNISTDPVHTTIAGQSLGGLSALFAALHAPARFGRVLAQSASLWWPADDPAGRGRGVLLDLVADAPVLPAHVRLEVGSEEWVLLPWYRALRDLLRERGAGVSYREFAGGHDALCWQEGLISGLPVAAGG